MGQDRLTRRGFVGGAAAAAAAEALARVPGADAARRRRRHRRARRRTPTADVIVVGAGLAGLTAARELTAHGRSFYVVEARDRVGGRVLNHSIGNGKSIELGAEYVGPTQDAVLGLMGDLKIGKFETWVNGQDLYVLDGTRLTWDEHTSPTGSAPPDPLILNDLNNVVSNADQMASEIDVQSPWNAPHATEWDRQSLDTWLRSQCDAATVERFMKLAALATRAIWGAEPGELSLLYTAWYIAASGNEQTKGTFERNFNTVNGAQMWRIVGGSGEIPMRLAAALPRRRIFLKRPVRRISQDGRGVTVVADGGTFRGKHAIVAVPPTLAGRIVYEPLMPELRDGLMQRVPQGTLMKLEAIYDRPFWRDKGMSGFAVVDNAPFSVVFDNSPPEGTPGAIFGFAGGDQARLWGQKSASERKQATIQAFADLFGDEALKPTDYVEMSWAKEEWTRGCPVGIQPPGVLSQYGPALRAPVGRVHWAGTETSTYWTGYMDGAVRSGKRAAAEVLAAL